MYVARLRQCVFRVGRAAEAWAGFGGGEARSAGGADRRNHAVPAASGTELSGCGDTVRPLSVRGLR